MRFVLEHTVGGYRFTLLGADGRTMATSEVYRTKADALETITSMILRVGDARVEDRTTPAIQ